MQRQFTVTILMNNPTNIPDDEVTLEKVAHLMEEVLFDLGGLRGDPEFGDPDEQIVLSMEVSEVLKRNYNEEKYA